MLLYITGVIFLFYLLCVFLMACTDPEKLEGWPEKFARRAFVFSFFYPLAGIMFGSSEYESILFAVLFVFWPVLPILEAKKIIEVPNNLFFDLLFLGIPMGLMTYILYNHYLA